MFVAALLVGIEVSAEPVVFGFLTRAALGPLIAGAITACRRLDMAKHWRRTSATARRLRNGWRG
ncbi:MAG: hypothetical protein MUE46_10895 [Xanthomonadales bacterium]|jgi:hypothetical protein|nr:hypothetical protein [Xanthomonadales bacterium]